MIPDFKINVTKEEKNKLLKIQNRISYTESFLLIICGLLGFLFEIKVYTFSIIFPVIFILSHRLLKRELNMGINL